MGIEHLGQLGGQFLDLQFQLVHLVGQVVGLEGLVQDLFPALVLRLQVHCLVIQNGLVVFLVLEYLDHPLVGLLRAEIVSGGVLDPFQAVVLGRQLFQLAADGAKFFYLGHWGSYFIFQTYALIIQGWAVNVKT